MHSAKMACYDRLLTCGVAPNTDHQPTNVSAQKFEPDTPISSGTLYNISTSAGTAEGTSFSSISISNVEKANQHAADKKKAPSDRSASITEERRHYVPFQSHTALNTTWSRWAWCRCDVTYRQVAEVMPMLQQLSFRHNFFCTFQFVYDSLGI